MKKWMRLAGIGCLGALVGLLLLAVVGFFLLRRTLDPAKVRPMAEARLSAALGKPVILSTGMCDLNDVRAAVDKWLAGTPGVRLVPLYDREDLVATLAELGDVADFHVRAGGRHQLHHAGRTGR